MKKDKARKPETTESKQHEKFLAVTAKLDATSKKGWELSQEKISQMAGSVMEELGYVKKNASSGK